MTKPKVSSKGQITIPKAIRLAAKIQPGTQLDFQIQKDGTILAIPVLRNISQLKGIIKKRKKPVTIAQIKKAISDGAQRL